MAKQTLPVDFKDDVLNVSMDGKRRYRLLLQEDGTYVLEDVTDYDTVGSTFGAAQINQTNQAVNQSADKGDVLGTLSQVKSNSDAKKIASANSLKELAVASNLKTYTTLAQLSLSAPVTVEQIFSAMPDNSYVQIDANNSSVATNMPINSSGLLEISKIAGGRNFARFTESISTNAANKTMWYGVFSWSGSVAFGGWKKILERDEILATDEEIEANTDPNKIASAVAVKRLNSELYAPVSGTVAMSVEQAVTHICENFVGRQRSARGRFACADFIGGFDIISDESGNCSGTIVSESETLAYSFYRRAGADAVLKKLGNATFSMTWHHNAQANVVAGLYSSIDLPGNYDTLQVTPKTVSPSNTTIAFKVNGETKQTITSAGATIDLSQYNADIIKLEIYDPYNGRVQVIADITLS